jgi:hypothetical protein
MTPIAVGSQNGADVLLKELYAVVRHRGRTDTYGCGYKAPDKDTSTHLFSIL